MADDLCRKAALAHEGGSLEVWGNGNQVRSITFIEDLISGIGSLMKSKINVPTTIDCNEYLTVNEIAELIIKASGKKLKIKHIKGPVGVASRNFSTKRLRSTGWRPNWNLADAVKIHYAWVKSQVEKKYGKRGN